MKWFLWLGIFFLSASWLFFIPQFTLPDLFVGTVLVILGTLCMIGGVSWYRPMPLDIKYVLLLVALIPALISIPFPYNLGPMVLTIGFLCVILLLKQKNTHMIPVGILLSGVILLFQTAVFPFYMSFVSQGHRLDLLSPVISPVANLLGLHTSTTTGLLFVQTVQQTYAISITWEKLGCYLCLNMFLGALILFVLFSGRKKGRRFYVFRTY